MKPIRRDSIPHDSRTRDAALRRLRRTNRWLIAGSAVLTGVFVDFAASAFSGHASASAEKGAAKSTHHSSNQPLKPPTQAPKAAIPPTASHTSETPPAEEGSPETGAAEAGAPASEAPPEPAPETREPETHEAAPPPESEPAEPVVSGGS